MEIDNDERREGYGELRAEVRNVGKRMDDLIVEIRIDRENDRADRILDRDARTEIWKHVNANTNNIASIKAVGKMFHGLWAAVMAGLGAMLWNGHK